MQIGLEALRVLTVLLPGFVTLSVVESISVCRPARDANRLIWALTYSVIDYVIYSGVVMYWSSAQPFRLEEAFPRTPIAVALLLGIAVLAGFAVAYYLHFDGHRIWRKMRMTSRTCRPDVWSDVFTDINEAYVVLHLVGERRLYGWPEYWPEDPRNGYFFLTHAEWLVTDDDGHGMVPVPDPGILVPRDQVELVQFVGTKEVLHSGRTEETAKAVI